MRILFDENIAATLKPYFPNHTVATVQQMGWRAIKNGQLLDRAEPHFDVLLSADQSMRYQQNFTNRKIALVTLVVPSLKLQYLVPFVPRIEHELTLITPGKVVVLQ